MVKGLIPAGAIIVDVLSKDNYDHWSALVKNYLLAQDLWDVVEATAEPPVPEEADQFIAWRKKTAAALYAIQISCGLDAFSVIKGISSANIAWDILAQTFKPQRRRSVQSANSSNNPDAIDKQVIGNCMLLMQLTNRSLVIACTDAIDKQNQFGTLMSVQFRGSSYRPHSSNLHYLDEETSFTENVPMGV